MPLHCTLLWVAPLLAQGGGGAASIEAEALSICTHTDMHMHTQAHERAHTHTGVCWMHYPAFHTVRPLPSRTQDWWIREAVVGADLIAC